MKSRGERVRQEMKMYLNWFEWKNKNRKKGNMNSISRQQLYILIIEYVSKRDIMMSYHRYPQTENCIAALEMTIY